MPFKSTVTPERLDAMIALMERGKGGYEAAESVGVSFATLNRNRKNDPEYFPDFFRRFDQLKRNKTVKTRMGKLPQATLDALLALVEGGMPAIAAYRQMGQHQGTILAIRRRDKEYDARFAAALAKQVPGDWRSCGDDTLAKLVGMVAKGVTPPSAVKALHAPRDIVKRQSRKDPEFKRNLIGAMASTGQRFHVAGDVGGMSVEARASRLLSASADGSGIKLVAQYRVWAPAKAATPPRRASLFGAPYAPNAALGMTCGR